MENNNSTIHPVDDNPINRFISRFVGRTKTHPVLENLVTLSWPPSYGRMVLHYQMLAIHHY